jgi:hypothetical protein
MFEKSKRAPRAIAKAAPKPDVVGYVIDTNDPAKAEAEYARLIPGWTEMPKRTRDEIVALCLSLQERNIPLRVSLSKDPADGKYTVDPATEDGATYYTLKLAETFGSGSIAFATDRLNDLVNHFNAHNKRGASSSDLNAALAMIGGVKPDNEMQATLATQMVMTNDAAMRALRMVGSADWVDQQQAFGNLAIKLMRTFTMQAETLAKLQRGGEQTIKHVHIDARNSQNVIAETVTTGGSNGKPVDQSYGQGASIAPLLGTDATGHGMPIPSDARPEAVPHPRGQGGSAEGEPERAQARSANG